MAVGDDVPTKFIGDSQVLPIINPAGKGMFYSEKSGDDQYLQTQDRALSA